MAVVWIAPEEVTPASTTWADVDNANIPDGASGAIIHVVNTTGTDQVIGWRKNGSADDRTRVMEEETHFWTMVGVDGSGIFEIQVGSTVAVDVLLVGYTQDEHTFFTNAKDHSSTATGAWNDIDISADTSGDTAIGAVFEVTGSFGRWGFRKNGSADDRTGQTAQANQHCGAVIGVDGSEICEHQTNTVGLDVFLTGYATTAAVFNTNGTTASLGSTAAWQDLPTLPSSASGAALESWNNSFTDQKYGFRKNGSAENIFQDASFHCWGVVESSAQIIEGQIENTEVDFFVTGYYLEAVAAPIGFIAERGPFRGINRGIQRGM